MAVVVVTGMVMVMTIRRVTKIMMTRMMRGVGLEISLREVKSLGWLFRIPVSDRRIRAG